MHNGKALIIAFLIPSLVSVLGIFLLLNTKEVTGMPVKCTELFSVIMLPFGFMILPIYLTFDMILEN